MTHPTLLKTIISLRNIGITLVLDIFFQQSMLIPLKEAINVTNINLTESLILQFRYKRSDKNNSHFLKLLFMCNHRKIPERLDYML